MPALTFVFAVLLANTPNYFSRESPVPKVQVKCNCTVKLETGLLAYQALTLVTIRVLHVYLAGVLSAQEDAA